MSPRLLRIDAMVFRADSVRFEPCTGFRAGADPALCDCGWLEHDHAGAEAVVARAPAASPAAARRASPCPRLRSAAGRPQADLRVRLAAVPAFFAAGFLAAAFLAPPPSSPAAWPGVDSPGR